MTKITQPPESTNNPLGNKRIEDIEAEEETVYQPQNELPFPTEVDLNEVFPEEDKDLNELFPDEETKLLLKKMQKNKKDDRSSGEPKRSRNCWNLAHGILSHKVVKDSVYLYTLNWKSVFVCKSNVKLGF